MNTHRGFTLIELMIVVAIIAILAAVALPAYQDYVIRSKITEGIVGVTPVKHAVSEGFETNGMTGVTSAIGEYPTNNTLTGSKYVTRIAITNINPGEITVTFTANTGNGLPTTLEGSTLVFTPWVVTAGVPAALSDDAMGAIDWSCQSETHMQSGAQGMNGGTDGTLPAKYAPSQCR